MNKVFLSLSCLLFATSAYGHDGPYPQYVPQQAPLVPVQPQTGWQPNWQPSTDGWRPALPEKNDRIVTPDGRVTTAPRQPDVFHYHLHEMMPQQKGNGWHYYPNTGCYQRDLPSYYCVPQQSTYCVPQQPVYYAPRSSWWSW